MDRRHRQVVPGDDHADHDDLRVPCRRRQAARARGPLAARLRRDRGQATVELALCLPVLALLVTAIVQLGVAFNHYVTLTDAVRVAARAAAVDGGSATAAQDALAQAAPDLPLASPPAVQVQGADVTVTASTPYSIAIFGLPLRSGLLTSSTTERVE